MELVSNYMQDERLRHMLNDLTQKTFGFGFEAWVTNGYFEGDYIPFSYVENGEMISNVSANRMHFLQDGVERYYIQIGTVMTDPEYRNRGLARRLLDHVVAQYQDQCDGLYLFGALTALDFYRNAGFTEELQYEYRLKRELLDAACEGTAFRPTDETLRQHYEETVRNAAPTSRLELLNRYSLQMFHTLGMRGVYYAEDLDCFAVMKPRAGELFLQSVVCKRPVALSDIVRRIPRQQRENSILLGFVPLADQAALFDATPYNGGTDYRMFCRGGMLGSIGTGQLYFPRMSHS